MNKEEQLCNGFNEKCKIEEPKIEPNEEFKEIFYEFSESQFKNIEKEKNKCKDQPYAFTNIGGLGEELILSLLPDYTGSASKGGAAYDLKKENEDKTEILDAKEIKTVSLDGTKECIKCKRKCPPFQPHCLKCKGIEFKDMSDSRCGISASAHIEYKNVISDYYFMIIKFNHEKECINIKCWKIKSDNEYFDDYVTFQDEKGKGDTCNCLPGSVDFHLSGPIKLFEYDLYKNEIIKIYFNFENEEYEKIPKRNFKNSSVDIITTEYTDKDKPNLSKKKNKELKDELKNLGLPCNGNKSVLVDRLIHPEKYNNKKSILNYVYVDNKDNTIFNNVDEIDYQSNIDKFKKKSGKKTTHGKKRGKVKRK